MTGKELFEIWAPSDSTWSPWVCPALFAQIDCRQGATPSTVDVPAQPCDEKKASPESAAVIDLAGAVAIRFAMVLAECGYRPVPIINASPGPLQFRQSHLSEAHLSSQSVVVLDMSLLVTEICDATQRLQRLTFACDAPPAFVLDALRLKGTNPLRDDMFDNRWMVFPQDFPSAHFLLDRGIKRVTLIQAEKTQPHEDLTHVLLRWQEAET